MMKWNKVLDLFHYKLFLIAAVFATILLFFPACKRAEQSNSDEFKQRQAALQADVAKKKHYWDAAFRIARSLSPESLAAQVLMTGVAGKESLSGDMKKLLHAIPVGAVMLFKYNIADSPAAVHRFISECTESAALPLPADIASDTVPPGGSIFPFVAIDHEGGDVYRLGQAATWLPSAERYLRILSQENSAQASVKPSSQSTVNTQQVSNRGLIKSEAVPYSAAPADPAVPATAPAAPVPAHPIGTGQEAALKSAWFVIRQAAYLSGRELRALGITMNLAPVAEPLAPENAGCLQNRSFAAVPEAAASAAAAFVQGMGEAGVTSVVKHFPASAAADPHRGPSVLEVDRKRLDYLVSPFSALLQACSPLWGQESLYPAGLRSLPIGAGGVMVAHTIIPSLEPDVPASLSSHVMQDWIKKELGFQGIVLADDFTMKAITSLGFTPETAMIEALRNGADMIMVWPRDLGRFHRHLVQEMKGDTLFRERITDAAGRIIYQKLIRSLVQGPGDGQADFAPDAFNEEGYRCMRKATEQFLQERNLR